MSDVLEILTLHFIYEIFKAIFWSQIRLFEVTRDYEFGSFSNSSKKHLHLIRCGVLHLIGDDQSVIKCSTSHIPEWFYFNISINLVIRKVLFKNVKHGFGPRLHLLVHVTG